jgi:hypothetical protein
LPGARGLDHLVHGAVAFGEILVREAEREVVNDFGFLIGEESLVIATRGMMGWESWEEWEVFFPSIAFFLFFPSFFIAAP